MTYNIVVQRCSKHVIEASTRGDADTILSAVTWITSTPTFAVLGGSKGSLIRFCISYSSCFTIAFTSCTSPFTSSISHFMLFWKSCSLLRVTARPLSPALAFGSGPLDNDDRPRPDLPSVANSVSTSRNVGGRSKYAACERSNYRCMKNA